MKNIPQARWLLWRREPHCHWCGVLTTLPSAEGKMYPEYKPGSKLSLEAATLDNLYEKRDPRRINYKRSSGEIYYNVLACHECNRDRARISQFMRKVKAKIYWEQKRKELV